MFFQKKTDQKQMNAVTFTIQGMHCTSCAMNIDGALEDTEGVISASTNYAQSKTTIKYDAEKISPEKLQAVISEVGYQADQANLVE